MRSTENITIESFKAESREIKLSHEKEISFAKARCILADKYGFPSWESLLFFLIARDEDRRKKSQEEGSGHSAKDVFDGDPVLEIKSFDINNAKIEQFYISEKGSIVLSSCWGHFFYGDENFNDATKVSSLDDLFYYAINTSGDASYPYVKNISPINSIFLEILDNHESSDKEKENINIIKMLLENREKTFVLDEEADYYAFSFLDKTIVPEDVGFFIAKITTLNFETGEKQSRVVEIANIGEKDPLFVVERDINEDLSLENIDQFILEILGQYSEEEELYQELKVIGKKKETYLNNYEAMIDKEKDFYQMGEAIDKEERAVEEKIEKMNYDVDFFFEKMEYALEGGMKKDVLKFIP